MADARLSQLPLEVLWGNLPAPDARISQVAIEILRNDVGEVSSDSLKVTQHLIEIAQERAGEARVSQIAIEAAQEYAGEARVTQLCIEYIKIAGSGGGATDPDDPLEGSNLREFVCLHGGNDALLELDGSYGVTNECLHGELTTLPDLDGHSIPTFDVDGEV